MARPSTPSNSNNSSAYIRLLCMIIVLARYIELAQQFSTYDVDDGRSSRACQDVFDEESFNQLREELCSERSFRMSISSFDSFRSLVGIASPGWDASLGEHILKNLRATDMPFNEKDLQDSLALLEVKLRLVVLLCRRLFSISVCFCSESETTQRTQGDDDQSTVQEEIRNL